MWKKSKESIREYNRQYMRKWRKANPEKVRLTKKRRFDKNLEIDKIGSKRRNARYRLRNKERIKLSIQKHIAANPERFKERVRLYWKRRAEQEPHIRIIKQARIRIYDALKGNSKKHKTLDYMGCTAKELCVYLESKFQKDMDWDNYGKGGWHVDHIKPLSSFVLKEEEQIKEACHFSNLQPLWEKENLIKGSKII